MQNPSDLAFQQFLVGFLFQASHHCHRAMSPSAWAVLVCITLPRQARQEVGQSWEENTTRSHVAKKKGKVAEPSSRCKCQFAGQCALQVPVQIIVTARADFALAIIHGTASNDPGAALYPTGKAARGAQLSGTCSNAHLREPISGVCFILSSVRCDDGCVGPCCLAEGILFMHVHIMVARHMSWDD